MLVPISLALEFGIILNGFLRKEPPIQIQFITWILMLQHANMLISYLMTKYSLCDHISNFCKTSLHSTLLSFNASYAHILYFLCNLLNANTNMFELYYGNCFRNCIIALV